MQETQNIFASTADLEIILRFCGMGGLTTRDRASVSFMQLQLVIYILIITEYTLGAGLFLRSRQAPQCLPAICGAVAGEV